MNDLEQDLLDFCDYHFGCPKANVVKAALREFIDRQLQINRGLREHFDTSRAKRTRAVLTVIK